MSMKITTGKVRLSYCNVFTPVPTPGGALKFSTSAIFPKSDTEQHRQLMACINAAVQDGMSRFWNNRRPANLKLPIRDGDIERPDDPAYVGSWFFNASATEKNAPALFDRELAPIHDSKQIYSGCYARMSILFVPYSVSGSNGVSARLLSVLKLADGPRMGSVVGSASDFDDGYKYEDNNNEELPF
jgi:hypothetical protein